MIKLFYFYRLNCPSNCRDDNESFGLILQNLNLICVIGTVETYLGFWGERLNFGIAIAEIQPKSMREKKKKVERENVEFRQRGYRNSSA